MNVMNVSSVYIPRQGGGEQGQRAEGEEGLLVVELSQEAVGQFGPAVEEILLQGGQGPEIEGPQQPVLAEEGVVGEQTGEGGVL